MLVLADTLGLYASGEKNLRIYRLLTRTIQKIQLIVKKGRQDFTEAECNDLILTALKYKQGTGPIRESLHRVLRKSFIKSKTFMPYYHEWFQMVANREELLGDKPTLKRVNELVKEVEERCEAKFEKKY